LKVETTFKMSEIGQISEKNKERHDDDSSISTSRNVDTETTDPHESGKSKKDESNDSYANNQFFNSETKKVKRLRLLVFAVLFVSATAVSALVYFITRAGEEKEFENEFSGLVKQISHAIYDIANEQAASLILLRVSYLSQLRETNISWPFVTLTSFQQRAIAAESCGNGLRIGVFPFIEQSNRQKWENYVALQGQSWM
jgi:hypothetical protein